MPKPTSHQRRRGCPSSPRETSAVSASTPPSPLLSARSTSVTYLNVTTMMSAQKITDSTPSTLTGVSGSACGPWNASRSVYSGLVPMSP
jgi:hypothetical protein